jgi:hypothetical protein
MFRLFAIALCVGVLVLPAQAKEVKIKHSGLTLNANLNLAPGKSLADGVVLMLHGSLGHKDMEIMRGLQDALIEHKISNLAFNLSLALDDRHGLIDCAGPLRLKDSNAVKEIALWVDWLKNKGTGPITILGHSRGGAAGGELCRPFSRPHDQTRRAGSVVNMEAWKDSAQLQEKLQKGFGAAAG